MVLRLGVGLELGRIGVGSGQSTAMQGRALGAVGQHHCIFFVTFFVCSFVRHYCTLSQAPKSMAPNRPPKNRFACAKKSLVQAMFT